MGGFGYHSASEDRFVLVSPPQVRDWSVSAILVEGNVAWVGLHRRPEGEEQPGGLLRYDLRSRETRRFSPRSIIRQIVRWGGNLHLATDGGLYRIAADGRLDRWVFEPGQSGETLSFPCQP